MRNAMSVDVEDYFHVQAFAHHINSENWDSLPCRVERNSDAVLALFAEHGVRATFFILGWVAERYPALIRRIAAGGHEVASHGFSHVRIFEQSREAFRDDIRRTKGVLEDLAGAPVRGYRAASFSITERSLWAHEILHAEGYAYSSSINPIRHDLYGMPHAPRFAFRPVGGGGILEVPMTTVELLGRRWPCAGGGFFRLLPLWWFTRTWRQVNEGEGQPAVFYFHPWEIDPGQPRQSGAPLKSRLRHYTNLSRMKGKLHHILRRHEWGRMDEIFLEGA